MNMECLSFGRFEIRPALRQVLVDGAEVPLGGRAFDLLMMLIEHRDRVVGKDEIFRKIWPGLVVEDNNLSVQISTLRRALGADVIATVTGRGYRLTAQPADAAPHAASVDGNLPLRTAQLFGRDAELAQLLDAHHGAACVTLCGLAGVGKTALATVAAQRIAARRRFAHGVWRVELTDVRDPALLVHAVCATVGIELEARQDPLRECVEHLQHREILLVLDNCEHVVDAASTLVGEVIAKATRVHVLATSQEPLRIPGERVMRLEPLPVPVSADAADAQDYGAVRLLIERVRGATGGNFAPSSNELVDVVEICRQLDGIPLALEFAAARVPLLGTAGVRSRLHDRLRLLAGGSRSAPTRHRSLQAALEWSHQLLSPRTQEILHRLAVFPSGFGLDGARLLLDGVDESDLIEHLNVLVDRSLVTRQPGPYPRYRMLETTRAFALDALGASADGVNWQARHAVAMRELCLRAARERDTGCMWQEMPNARTALAWALTEPAYGETAVTIATYTSVVLAAGGAIREALDNLLRVQHLVDEHCSAALVARYWHWVGRLGVEGRLPSAPCIEALERADAMFTGMSETRHRHACQRHLAEAHLRSGHFDLAERHLLATREIEATGCEAADRMRRLRVEALLADARNEHLMALRHAQSALVLAEAHGVDRYRLLLMADMGWTHLQAGHAEAAVTSFQELLLHLDHSIRQGLARAHALSGLTAALVAAGRIDDAVRGAGKAVRSLQQANLLRSRCDVFAWVAAAAGNVQAAAQLIGAGEAFCTFTQTERDPISQLARERATSLVEVNMTEDDRGYWRGQGSLATDDELMHLLQRAFDGASTRDTGGA